MAKVTLAGFTGWINRKMIHFAKKPNFHQCTVCNCIPEVSVMMPCGHYLCSVCLKVNVAIDMESSCPRDKVKFDILDVPIKNISLEAIVGLSVVCSNSSRGCTYVGPLGSLLAHENKCHYHLQKCRYCGKDMIYYQLVDHIRSECTGIQWDVAKHGEQAAATVVGNISSMDNAVVARCQNGSYYWKELQYRDSAASVDDDVEGIRK